MGVPKNVTFRFLLHLIDLALLANSLYFVQFSCFTIQCIGHDLLLYAPHHISLLHLHIKVLLHIPHFKSSSIQPLADIIVSGFTDAIAISTNVKSSIAMY